MSPAGIIPIESNGMTPSHKRIRLDLALYGDPGNAASITIGTRNRQPVFSEQNFAAIAQQLLAKHALLHAVSVYAYCIMPDHVHLVMAPSPICDIP
ncbi:MAG: transposase, partial [Chloroflexota bacterium]|nr:transposase [Chloroflexota bacterium]